MDILIKSFNRPYYLDRCIQSIYKCVQGGFKIKVLDDGTPEKYLQKIRNSYPEVQIFKSDQYNDKISSIEENLKSGKEIDGFTIPTSLWKKAVSNATEFFVITEEDVWFTEMVNLEEIKSSMMDHNVHLCNLGWLGNSKMDKDILFRRIDDLIQTNYPKKLFTSSQSIMDMFFYNKNKFFSILCRLGISSNEMKKRYWTLNSIMMGLFRKDYWSYIWKDADGKVDEKQQLRNASVWFHRYKHNKNMVARVYKECMKTTFSSSATNSYHQYGINVDINEVNFILNELWFEGRLNSMQNYPNDLPEQYICDFLDEKNDPKCKSEDWKQWASMFKKQYRDQGAQVD